MTHVEPEWTESDRAWALALGEVHADTCAGCGQPRSESTHPESEGTYEAVDPTRCHSCTVVQHQQDEYAKRGDISALQFETQRRRR